MHIKWEWRARDRLCLEPQIFYLYLFHTRSVRIYRLHRKQQSFPFLETGKKGVSKKGKEYFPLTLGSGRTTLESTPSCIIPHMMSCSNSRIYNLEKFKQLEGLKLSQRHGLGVVINRLHILSWAVGYALARGSGRKMPAHKGGGGGRASEVLNPISDLGIILS